VDVGSVKVIEVEALKGLGEIFRIMIEGYEDSWTDKGWD